MSARWHYPPELVDALASFGVAPRSHTPPALVREQVDDLYKRELRALRHRLLIGEFDRPSYVDRIVALRKEMFVDGEHLAGGERICQAPS